MKFPSFAAQRLLSHQRHRKSLSPKDTPYFTRWTCCGETRGNLSLLDLIQNIPSKQLLPYPVLLFAGVCVSPVIIVGGLLRRLRHLPGLGISG